MRKILHNDAQKYEIPMVLDGIKDYNDEIPSEYIVNRIKKFIKQFTDKKIYIKRDFSSGIPNSPVQSHVTVSEMYQETLYPYHSHDFYEVNVILKGKCIEYVNDTPVYLDSGDVLIMRPETVYHSFYSVKGTKALNILIEHELFNRIVNEIEKTVHTCFADFIKNHSYIILHGFELKELNYYIKPLPNKEKAGDSLSLFQRTALDNLASEYRLRMLILFMANKVLTKEAVYEFNEGKRVAAHSADTVVRYIKEHYTDINMEKLIKKFGYSERQLLRMVKNHTGNSFKTQVMLHRIQKARQLLEYTDLTVKEISEIIGYESPEYFCRLFKRETYRTPLEYRNELKAKNNEI